MADDPLAPSTPKSAMAFFDGQNLYRHAKDAFGYHHPNYDPIALHKAVCAHHGWRPTLVRFYTGVPNEKYDLPWTQYWSKRILAMKRAGIVTTTRPVKYREKKAYDKDGNEETVIVPQEKGIDVRIALDIVLLAIKKQYDVAVIYSQDQDLNEIVPEVKLIAGLQEREIELACAFPESTTATFKRGVRNTTWFQMDQAFYDACLDPRDYR